MKRNWLSYPYIIWMLLFILLPLLLVLFYSVTVRTEEGIRFTLEHFQRFMEPIYLRVLFRSVKLALICTILCLVLGYPMAMILAGNSFKKKEVMVFLIVVPMWMNFLLRTYAWMTLLEKNGLINTFLNWLGFSPLNILYTEKAVVLGMVYNFLPFMILPIYSVLKKIDKNLIEAAEDLGANSFTVFRKVIFPPVSRGSFRNYHGLYAGCDHLCHLRLLGGGQFTLIGNLIEQQFLLVGDWNFGSTISMVMMIVILLSIGVMSRYEENEGWALVRRF